MKFCVVGTGRCGTRLLRSMLNTHPELFVFNETHWLVNLYDAFGTAEVSATPVWPDSRWLPVQK